MSISKFNQEGYHDPTTYEAFMNIERERRERNLDRLARTVKGYRPMVFICSPYAGDGMPVNILNARRYCRFAVDTGHNPFAPHLFYTQFLNDALPEERKTGMELGLAFMTKCAEVWVFGEYISPGMEQEIHKAEARAMKVRYFTADCREVSE